MAVDLTKLKKSTVAMIGFFLFNMTVAQFETARAFVMPLLQHHPRIAAFVSSALGIAILLHRPEVQKFLKSMNSPEPAIPAEVGNQVQDVKVVTKEETCIN